MTRWAPYMAWAKKRPRVKYDLAGSNLLACTDEDLPGFRDVVRLSGDNADGYVPLLEAIAQRYGVSTDRVAPACGAGGANFVALAALVRPGDEVLVERPTYDPILGALRLLGADIRRFDRVFEHGYVLDPERVNAALTARTRLIVVTSPHNPSGALCDTAALDIVGETAARIGARVLVDEVYLDAVYEDRPPPAATRGDVFITTNSLTKAWGLAGLRTGWILAAPNVAEAVRRARDAMEGTASMPSDSIAAFAFGHLDRLEARARSILQPNLERLAGFLDARDDLEWVRPAGGTIAFPRLRYIDDTRDLALRLQREYDTAIVPGYFFDDPRHIRIAFGCRADVLAAGLESLRAALDSARR